MLKQCLFMFSFIIVLVACTPQAEEAVLPTLIVTEAPLSVEVTEEAEITPTEIRRATLPPTWTPTQDPDAPDAADAAQSSNALIGGEGQTVIETGPTQPAPMIQAPPTPLAVCQTFGEDRDQNTRTYIPGEGATVVWSSVEGAIYYSITLISEAGASLLVDYVDGTHYTFGPDLLTDRGYYGWEVYPVDTIGQQMCLSRGAQLFPDPNALP